MVTKEDSQVVAVVGIQVVARVGIRPVVEEARSLVVAGVVQGYGLNER